MSLTQTPPPSARHIDFIEVVGAKEHNLRDLSVRVPRDRLTVITGLSGSGKSSLAFDTLFQEGQRRFMESLSAYARQFLGSMEKPKVERVDGLSPTLCIDQKTVNRNPRSTVGTVTEILDHLRLLMARLGTPHCPICDTPLGRTNPSELAGRLIEEEREATVTVMAPIVQERKGEYRKELAEALAAGWVRARVDGEIRRLDEEINLQRYEKHSIELVVDRVSSRPENRARIVEAVEQAVKRTEGTVSLLIQRPGEADRERLVAMDRACPLHGATAPELEPRLFSFNAPQGACPTCTGLGFLEDFDLRLLIDAEARVVDAVRVLTQDEERLPFSSLSKDTLAQVLRALGLPAGQRWSTLSQEHLVLFLEGGDVTVRVEREGGGRASVVDQRWPGILPACREVWKYSWLKRLSPFRRRVVCPSCAGARLNPIARAVRFQGRTMQDLAGLTVGAARAFFAEIVLGDERAAQVGAPILRELRARLGFLADVGLDYLGLDRSAATLSGGEGQRIRLAGQVGAGLQGVTYILDEPSIGLHGRDQARLLHSLKALRDRGNTVIVVEHDPMTMAEADWLIEVGPGAGVGGGRLIAAGPPSEFLQTDAITARFLRGEERIPVPKRRRPVGGAALELIGAKANNLQNLTVRFPLNTLTVLTGVSGSGKSTLLLQTLTPALAARLHGALEEPGAFERLEGVQHIGKVVRIDQDPIGRTPRSNPATYTGLFDLIRNLFAELPLARERGWKKGRFSFNVAGGRCEECKGAGVVTVEMQFLADVEIPCEACDGRRFNPETLEARYRGRTIRDVLEMSIGEASSFFANHKGIKRILDTLVEVGLDYIALGQPSTTLSGGEAQRIKLATELARPANEPTLYVLDEPTTGLHMADVRRLLHALNRLVDAGNSVFVVEHDTDVIKCADHLIDLGPDGGTGGGRVVGEGTPEEVARLDTPTGRVLREVFARESAIDRGRGGELLEVAEMARPVYRVHAAPEIRLRGVRTHNLRSVDINLPQGKLSVITGPSGSGKTSLAFDTLFAEGQRRYVESLSTYARRFLGRMDKPPLDLAEGLAPAIAIDQRNRSGNPRSTVATTTEIYDAFRLIYARIGRPHCPHCWIPLAARPPSRAARELRELAPGAGWLLARLAPGSHAGDLVRGGYLRIWQGPLRGGSELLLEELIAKQGEAGALGEVYLVIDRLDPERVEVDRLAEAFADAYKWSGGEACFLPRNVAKAPSVWSSRPDCPQHGGVLPEELTPRHFSFNSHLAACPDCLGLGRRLAIDPFLALPHPERPLTDALAPGLGPLVARSPRNQALLELLFKEAGVSEVVPVGDWPAELRRKVLYGDPSPREVSYQRTWGGHGSALITEKMPWPGILPMAEGWTRAAELRREVPCETCAGERLQPVIRAVRLGTGGEGGRGLSISQVSAMTVEAAIPFWSNLELNATERLIASQPVEDIVHKLRFLLDVGLGYLHLDRSAESLSGGESQRIRLATQLGSRLTGTLYVLDEPTIGLHPRDTQRLLATLGALRDLGNTLVVVEHDNEVMRAADHLVDMGPGAGEHGGRVMDSGSPAEVAGRSSLTGQYLSGQRRIPVPVSRRSPAMILQAPASQLHNLKGAVARIPLGVLTGVSGVSGSGKSTLILDHFAPWFSDTAQTPVWPEGVPKRLVVVDQQPIGRSPRSTPATFLDIWNPIRSLFAQVPVARERGWGPSRFSWNTPDGRCEACEGRGSLLIEMHFLSDVWVRCDQCGGRRFTRETLEARWRDHSIADVLEANVDEAIEIFASQRKIRQRLATLSEVGLGYLRLGQPANTLSGGEAQRLKLATELFGASEPSVILMDEPTNGLHPVDIEKLVAVLHRLVDAGHTVVVIEHHPDLLLNADHIIDLGPEGGSAGGQVLFEGTPEQLAARLDNHTGRALAARLVERGGGTIRALNTSVQWGGRPGALFDGSPRSSGGVEPEPGEGGTALGQVPPTENRAGAPRVRGSTKKVTGPAETPKASRAKPPQEQGKLVSGMDSGARVENELTKKRATRAKKGEKP